MEKKHRKHLKTRKSKAANEVRFWECANCGNKGELMPWSYEDIVAKGEPVCPSCSYDMRLVVS